MESVISNKELAHKLAVVVVLLGMLAGLLAVSATGAFAQTPPPDGP